jgi:hypothetical protein
LRHDSKALIDNMVSANKVKRGPHQLHECFDFIGFGNAIVKNPNTHFSDLRRFQSVQRARNEKLQRR